MFFNRFGKQASKHSPLSSPASPSLPHTKTSQGKKSCEQENLLRRRAVALALAVQFALPIGMLNRATKTRAAGPSDLNAGDSSKANSVKSNKTAAAVSGAAAQSSDSRTEGSFEKLYGTTRDAMPRLSTSAGPVADAFQSGVDQILSGDYEKAVTTLQQLPVEGLNTSDGKVVDDTIARTRQAAREQRSAKADLLIGQESVTRRQFDDAAMRLRRSMANCFADAATRQAAARSLVSVRTAVAKQTAIMQPIHADVAAPVAGPVTTTVTTTVAATVAAPMNASATLLAQATPAPTPPGDALPATTPATPATPADAAAPATTPAAPAPAPMPAPAAAPQQTAPPQTAPPLPGNDEGAAAALDAAVKFKVIQKQKDMYDAQKLVEKARSEQAGGMYTDSLKDYQQAAKLDPNNEQAAAGLGEVSDILGLGNSISRPTRQADAIKVAKEAIIYHFNDSIQRADTDIAAKKFVDAQKDIEQAQNWAQHDPTLFLQPELNDFNSQIGSARLRLETAKEQDATAAADRALTDTQKNQADKDARYRRDQEKTIAGLVQDARQFTDEGKYIEALAVVDNIQRLDPNNAYAGGVRQFLEDRAHNAAQRKYQELYDKNFNEVLNDAREKIIPYEDIIRFSPDWPKISEQRDEEVKADRGEDADAAALNAKLEVHLPDLRFNANSLSDVLDFLRDATGTNIYVDWPALERASIARDAPVTAKLHDIKFSKALELIFKSVEGEDEDHKLGYTLDEGVITISTKKELSKNTITRRYDINDLLFVAPDYNNAPDLSLQSASQGQSGGGGAGGGGGQGGGQSLFQNANGGQQQQNNGQDRANRVDEIKKYITDNVDSTTWKDNGGDVGSISSSPLRAVLLITQTPEAHRKVQSVLDSLRASQALQVSIETRFLVVQRNYLEDIGVNADFEFNPLRNPANARSGVNSSRFAPISITQNQVTDNTTFRDANGNVVSNPAQGSRTLDWISNVGNAAVPGSIPANPADYPNPLVVSGSYVDNLTVTFLVRAVQANVNTTSLTAPRLTLFSGQRAVLIVQTQQAYVSSLTPVVAPGAALFDPTVSTTTATGVVLSVQATVSPDRKYVFLDLQPQLARLRALVPFSISAVVTPVNNIVTPTTPQIVSGTLQLPTIDLTIVRTSVSVPDGATLLLGGQTLAAETTREQGVPVLSKIPFLKRAFTNRATAQDEQILLILVKPTILIQHEQEIKQFPQLSSKVN